MVMEVTSLAQARPDLRRRPKGERDAAADDSDDMESPAAGPADLYDVLGYRRSASTITTQQWLAMRCITL